MELNGKWKLLVTDGQNRRYETDALVPGCVHTDLMRAGILPDLFWRDSNECAGWVENCDAIYSRSFFADSPEPDSFITFEGLDTYCEVFLNGVCIGAADDMFISHSFPADGALRQGENLLEVRFRSPVRSVAGLPKRPGAFTTERLYTRRIQCTYGWDWVARFVTVGIWKPVRLEVRRPDRLRDIYVFTESINPFTAKLCIRGTFEQISGNGTAELTLISPRGETVFTKTRAIIPTELGADTTVITERIDLTEPMLWYPAGYGEQPLYTLVLKVNGKEEKPVEFGIRTVEIIEPEDAPGSEYARLAEKLKKTPQLAEWDRNEGSSGFILLVNNVPVFCPGANWVPCEPFPSEESDEKLCRLVSLAREGNFRMLRVWGGGIFEHDGFYSACDRNGILVTQDFLMACGTYPEEDDGFIDKLRAEAKEAALRLRNHPCLVWWSGDNENAIFGDENSPSYNGRRSALEAIGPVLEELDPNRRFLPSSPYGGVPYASGVRGTSHNTQYLGTVFDYVEKGDFENYREFFDSFLVRFCAEQPAMGMPYVSSMKNFLTEEDIFGGNTEALEYHTQSNPALKYSLYQYVDMLTQGIFGPYRSGQDRTEKMQMLQCERIRLSMELFRRNMWYSSGLIYWMFNDCWPAANSWSIADYYCRPKPAFYTFAAASAPLMGSVTKEDGKYRAFVSHTGPGTAKGRARLSVYNVRSGSTEWETEADFELSNGAVCLMEADEALLSARISRETVLLLEVGDYRSFYLPFGFRGTDWEEGGFTVTAEDENSITVRAEVTLPYLLLDVPFLLDRNSMFLKKGESVTLRKKHTV